MTNMLRGALRRIALLPLACLALLASLDALAHGERAQEPYLRTRTVQFYDVQFDRAKIAVNEEFTITGRFRLMQDWPDAVSLPETVYMSAYSPGPVITRVESYVNGVPARQSFADFQLGRDYEFRLVREALMEREVLWGIAPHIIWPLRFVLPHHRGLRPAWLLRLGLFLYDHIGGRNALPATQVLDLARRLPDGRAEPEATDLAALDPAARAAWLAEVRRRKGVS